MKFMCRKVRDTNAVYANNLGQSTLAKAVEVFLVPVESQHAVAGGVLEVKLWLWNSSPYQEGHEYELNLQDVEEYVKEVHTRKSPLLSG